MDELAGIAGYIQAAVAAGGPSLRARIASGIRSGIAAGALRSGDRMPSTRELAASLKVSPVTVSAVFRQLISEGLLRAQVGQGTFVQAMTTQAASILPAGGGASLVLAENPGARVRLVSRWISAVDRRAGINLVGGYGDTNLPPAQNYLRRLKAMLKQHPEVGLDFARGLGDGAAREAVSRFAARHIGADVRPEHVFVGTSAHQFLDVIIRTFLDAGDVVVTDTPSYYGALDLFAIAGLKVAPIACDELGPDPAALERALAAHRPKLIYLTGSPSNPAGSVVPIDRQQEILRVALQHQVLVVEDSSLFPYWFATRPSQLKSIDRAGQVIHLCSFSKMLFSGLRVAAAMTSGIVAPRLGNALQSYWRIGSVLPQRVLAGYLPTDRFAADLNQARLIYQQRRNALAGALREHLDLPDLPLPAGGLSLWLDLPPGISGDDVCERLVTHGVYALPGEVFLPSIGARDGLRLCYAQVAEDDLRRAAAIVASAIKSSSGG
jgi:GntR family transcriptional regulator/MocR family aminotransferase